MTGPLKQPGKIPASRWKLKPFDFLPLPNAYWNTNQKERKKENPTKCLETRKTFHTHTARYLVGNGPERRVKTNADQLPSTTLKEEDY